MTVQVDQVEKETVTGIVLSDCPIGEYDKRVVLLTKEHGKLSAFARGARRQNSPLLAATMPFSFGEFMITEGRTSNSIIQADITNYFTELRGDLAGVSYGFYFLELADYYTKEYNDEIMMLGLLYQSLKALSNSHIGHKLVRRIYEWKVFVVNGEYPDVDQTELSPAAKYTLHFIESAPLERLYTFTVTDEVLKELEQYVGEYAAGHIDRQMKSLGMLGLLE